MNEKRISLCSNENLKHIYISVWFLLSGYWPKETVFLLLLSTQMIIFEFIYLRIVKSYIFKDNLAMK